MNSVFRAEPQALLVALELARDASEDPEFCYFADYVAAAGQQRVEPAERFFMDMEHPASHVAERRLGRNLSALLPKIGRHAIVN